MAKSTRNARGNGLYDGDLVQILAKKYGKTPRYIRMIRDGDRNNEAIFSDYMAGIEGKNLLLKEIERIIPF